MTNKEIQVDNLDNLLANIKEDPLLQSRLLRTKNFLALDLDIESLCFSETFASIDSKNLKSNLEQQKFYLQPDSEFNTEKYLLKIRQLVYVGASWDKIKPYAWPVFRSQKTAESASRLVEYAFLFGSLNDTLEVIDMLDLEFGSKSYYTSIHEAVRSSLILRLWQNNFDSYIEELIQDSIGIEKLYHLSSYLKEKDKQLSFEYFTQNASLIISALDKYSLPLGIDKSKLICKIAKIGISIHQYKKADFILRSILPDDPYYPEAIGLITEIASLSHELIAKYLQPFFSERSPSKRLELIDYLLSILKQNGGFKDFEHFKTELLSTSSLKDKNEDFFIKSLTYFFINPYCIVPKSSSTDISLVKLITKYKDLSKKIPTLFHTLKNITLSFSASDRYVWEFIHSEYELSQDKIKIYWYHISSVKLFLINQLDESYLFKAKSFLENITPDFNTPYDWESLYSSICKNLKSSSIIEDSNKKKILLILKILPYFSNLNSFQQKTSPYSLTCKDIDNYLNNFNYIPQEYIYSLIDIAKKEKNSSTYLNLIKRKISLYGVNEKDLKELWYFSSLIDDRDFAWRVASCLKFRSLLPSKIESLWLLSGEARTNYPEIFITEKDINLLLSSFKKEDAEFISACLKMEDSLGELLSCINPNIININYPQTKYKNVFRKICVPKNTYFAIRNTKYDLSSSELVSSFLVSSPINQLLFYIKTTFSLFLFTDNNNYLINSLKTLLPKLANEELLELYSKEIHTWLKNLDPSKRLHFTILTKKIFDYSPLDLSELIHSFIFKCLACIYQNHYTLLSYLKKNRYSDYVINSLIEWIVSDSYSKLRSMHHLESKTPISKSVMNIKF